MQRQRFAIFGEVWSDDHPRWQSVLARAREASERPRCLCVPCGVDMYVAHHWQFVVKRMPETGGQHHPRCPSYELPAQQSGLGELLGEAVLESGPGVVDLRVDFPWIRNTAPGSVQGPRHSIGEVGISKRRMSLRALMHFLFERAGFNRWTPAMEGRRNQGVLHKYLMGAAEGVSVNGQALVGRLYVPEPFNESTHAHVARRRCKKLAVLRPLEGGWPLALVLGEFKGCEVVAGGRRVWIRHMPDTPFLMTDQAWGRLERRFSRLLEAWDTDTGHRVRLFLAALVAARREYTYEIDAASLMLTSEHWIPIEGMHEVPLVQALVAQRRRFVKPLRYDARTAAAFPNALLLDVGPAPAALHLLGAFMTSTERSAKEKSITAARGGVWVWGSEERMPPLPLGCNREFEGCARNPAQTPRIPRSASSPGA